MSFTRSIKLQSSKRWYTTNRWSNCLKAQKGITIVGNNTYIKFSLTLHYKTERNTAFFDLPLEIDSHIEDIIVKSKIYTMHFNDLVKAQYDIGEMITNQINTKTQEYSITYTEIISIEKGLTNEEK